MMTTVVDVQQIRRVEVQGLTPYQLEFTTQPLSGTLTVSQVRETSESGTVAVTAPQDTTFAMSR